MPGVPPSRFAYLGPEGSFTEAALRSLPAARSAELSSLLSVGAALDAVRDGEADAALVPLESSVGGSVSTTLDELAAGEPLHISREVVYPVRFALLARPGAIRRSAGGETAVGTGIATVAGHPQAQAQCRHWLAAHLPAARWVPAASNSEAARLVRDGEFDAALAGAFAAERYRLSVVADGVGDNPDAVTRFVLVTRPGAPPQPTGADRTSCVAFIADDHPGALMEVLTEFAVRGINLSRIESRPTGERLGRYCFSFDCEGHIADARVGEALSALKRICHDVRFLGSYPRADGGATSQRPGTADTDFADAAAWLAHLREGRG